MTTIDLAGCAYRARWARPLPSWSVQAGPGDVVHLVAANGAGKTTFLRAALGLVPATWRTCRLPQPGRRRWASISAGVPHGLRVEAYVELAAARWRVGGRDLERSLAAWALGPFDQRWGRRLSAGEHRAVALAVALAGTPEAVLLDEPTVALDLDRQDVLVAELERLRTAGTALVLASHDRWLHGHVAGAVAPVEDAP